MTNQEKLSILIRDFRKLDDTRKDYIGKLTRILAVYFSPGDPLVR